MYPNKKYIYGMLILGLRLDCLFLWNANVCNYASSHACGHAHTHKLPLSFFKENGLHTNG